MRVQALLWLGKNELYQPVRLAGEELGFLTSSKNCWCSSVRSASSMLGFQGAGGVVGAPGAGSPGQYQAAEGASVIIAIHLIALQAVLNPGLALPRQDSGQPAGAGLGPRWPALPVSRKSQCPPQIFTPPRLTALLLPRQSAAGDAFPTAKSLASASGILRPGPMHLIAVAQGHINEWFAEGLIGLALISLAVGKNIEACKAWVCRGVCFQLSVK